MTHFPGVETPGYKCIVSNETIDAHRTRCFVETLPQ